MHILRNPHRGSGLLQGSGKADTAVSTDAEAVRDLLALCPMAEATPLLSVPDLSRRLGIDEVWVKDERGRMGRG